MRKYSVIIPVYNRPDEIDELLASLCKQTYQNFEVLVVEDGSTNKCEHLMEKYTNKLDIQYFYKSNTGQGFSRNYGFERATGDYFVVFDSDCLIPEHYFQAVETQLTKGYLDAFGGPDSAHGSFTATQKAISYSMTSVITTGGIRGNKKHVGAFQPRSFNMGISREVFEKTRGYALTNMGEDIEFSLRMISEGFKVGLIEEAYVYHKRRTNFSQFYKQVNQFGRSRVRINRIFPGELKAVHLLPSVFILGVLGWLLSPLVSLTLFKLGGAGIALLSILLFVDSLAKNKSLKVAGLSVAATFIQLFGYGGGILSELIKRTQPGLPEKQQAKI